MSADSADARDIPRHPIRVVTRRTGLSPSALRAWERRYGAVQPGRSDGGQRLYSDRDVQKLVLLVQATAAGRNISQVAGLTAAQLEALIHEDAVALPPVPVEPGSEPGDEATTDLVQEALEAVEQMDGSRLEKLLMRSAVVLEPEPLVSQLILPLLRRMGTLWEHGNIGPAQEHVASAAIRSFLGWLIDAIRTPGDAPLLICGTPAGHRHDLGALLSCVVGADAGWRTVYLGPDLPSDELALAARRLGARALALSAIYPSEDPNIPHEFATLLGLLPGEVMVFAGGPAVEAYRRDIEQLGGRVVGSLSALREALVEVGGVGAADEGVLRGWLRSRTDGPDVGRRQG